MHIHDFAACATPVAECDRSGRVLSLNPAARRLGGFRIGAQLPVRGSICRLPQGSCLAVDTGDRLWLMFCGFLYFDHQGVIFPTAEEYLSLAGKELLHTVAQISRLADRPVEQDNLQRIRALLYDRFSFLFDRRPERFCQVDRFLCSYREAADRSFPSVGARIGFAFDYTAPGRYLNARNAAILLTEFCCFLLAHSEKPRVDVSAVGVGETICLRLQTKLRKPLPAAEGNALSELAGRFPARAVELCAADMVARACDYRMHYRAEAAGTLELSVYLQTETDLHMLLDPVVRHDLTGELVDFLAFCVKICN